MFSNKNITDISYQTLRCNVDILNLIQLGLTFTDENGRYPTTGPCTWQFHFKFNLSEDMYSQESIELLTKSGIDFQKHEISGISIEDFGALLTSSGVVMSDNVRWISFHSGYDFGYLLKVLICIPLPQTETQFFTLLKAFFPIIYDIKHLMKSCKNLKGGLQDVADTLGVMRIGPQHQAGSDSLLTATTFFQMRRIFFDDKIDDIKYSGQLFGLSSYTIPASNPIDSLMLLPPLLTPMNQKDTSV